MKSSNTIDVLNYQVFTDNLVPNQMPATGIINTINPHSYCVAKQDKVFAQALMASDILLPDGVGIVWAAKFLKQQKINKIAGYDIFIHSMQVLNQQSGSCFFLGASNQTLDKIKHRAAIDFPNVTVNTFSPPYKPEFSKEDNVNMVAQVNQAQPDILFVGLTAPKQEKWVYQNKQNLDVKTTCAIGAVFDFYAGTVQRPSQFWINLGLEWLPRLVKEPKRLFYRNFVSTPKFIFYVFKHRIFKG